MPTSAKRSFIGYLAAVVAICGSVGFSPIPQNMPAAVAETFAPHGAIGAVWSAHGDSAGLLGNPTGDEIDGLRNSGASQAFQGGTVFWSPSTGAHIVRGAILGKFGDFRWESGFLGYPIGDEIDGLRNGGALQNFQGGKVYWSPATGTHFVRGAIQDRWGTAGWENGALGYPTSDEYSGLRNGGASQAFQGGTVFWSPTTGAHIVRGAILAEYEQDNFENSPLLGYPTSDEYQRGTDAYQDFQGARLHWYASLNFVWFDEFFDF